MKANVLGKTKLPADLEDAGRCLADPLRFHWPNLVRTFNSLLSTEGMWHDTLEVALVDTTFDALKCWRLAS
jgi:hypothetical protein